MGPIFIIGMPRSGTKLIREILNRHHNISIPVAESGFIPFFYKRRSVYGDLDDNRNFQKILNEFKKTNFYYHITDADMIWNETKFCDFKIHSVKDFIQTIFILHAQYEKKKIWGDKSPEYLHDTKLIKQLFPDARFIHIIRDVRDYCLSVRKAWNKNIYRATQKWVNGIGKIKKDSSIFIHDYYELNYENLIDDPENQTKMLCKWLGINYSKDMIALDKYVENLGDAKNKPGILKNNYKKWKTELKPIEIKRIECIAGETLVKLGYEATQRNDCKPLTNYGNLFYLFLDIINLLLFRSKEYNSRFLASKRLFRDLKNKLYTRYL